MPTSAIMDFGGAGSEECLKEEVGNNA
jgi:hypothetical protein